METQKTFKMTYSPREQEEIRAIREKYTPGTEDKMARLRALDASAGRKATAVSLAFGIGGTLVMGLGMSLVMSEFGALLGDLALPVGIVTGLTGMVLLALAYPLYSRILKRERKRIAPEILRLTDELMQ